MKFIRKTLTAIAFGVTASLSLLSTASSVNADVLVASSLSHSIEWFANNGRWIDTFAFTGSRVPYALASSPITGEVAVATYTDTVLRYTSSGRPLGELRIPQTDSTSVSVAFDRLGQLYVVTYEGGQVQAQNGYYVTINRYDVTSGPSPILRSSSTTDLVRGNQSAFDGKGNLCIASPFGHGTTWLPGVKCYDQSGRLQYDHTAALQSAAGATPTVRPSALAFDPTSGRMFTNSYYGNEILANATAFGPFSRIMGNVPFAMGYFTADTLGNLYVPVFPQYESVEGACGKSGFYFCNPRQFKSDVIYKVTTGATPTRTIFIKDHAYGPLHLIFANVTRVPSK
jgi:hypothetical protein